MIVNSQRLSTNGFFLIYKPTYRALFAETRLLSSLPSSTLISNAHQLLGPERKATASGRYGLVGRVLNPGPVELCDELVELL